MERERDDYVENCVHFLFILVEEKAKKWVKIQFDLHPDMKPKKNKFLTFDPAG